MSAHADLLRNLADHPDLAVEITMGTEHWRNGEIELQVRGDGEVTIHQHRAGGQRDYGGRIEADRVRRLGEELAADDLGDLRDSGGDRKPDDVPVRIRLARDGETLHDATVRHSDRWRDERLNRVIRRYEELVKELTDGALPHGRAG